MGKKRRLKSAKAKFGAKHSNHPRMLHLNGDEAPEVEEVLPEPEPEVVLQEEKVEIKPKPLPKPKTVKNPRRPTRKKATKKTSQATT